MRIVLDTNVLISACWKPDGLEARALQMALDGAVTPCTTDEVWEEYREVLTRKKFKTRAEAIGFMLLRLQARALRVIPTETLSIAMDEDDNRFLECAAAAGADYLITGNLRDYPAELVTPYMTTRIVNAREFLNAVLGQAFLER